MGRTKKKVINLSREQILKIYNQGPDAVVQLIFSMQDMINELAANIEEQEERIKRLEAIINEDSHNSSKPPSTDSPYKKKTKSLRKKGGKPGGQKGHKGTNLRLTENPDEIVFYYCTGQCACGYDLSKENPIEYERRQVFDIPEIKIHVTEHRGEIKECPDCGKIHNTAFPEGITQKAQYGNRLKSFSLFLRQYGFLSYDRLQETLEGLLGINISTGTLVNFTNSCASRLSPVVEKIRCKLIASAVLHCDESGHKITGKLNWLHVASNKVLTYYFSHPKRGKAAIDAMGILPSFTGTAIHDHWKAYYEYDCDHSLCNAHHLRELIYFAEEEKMDWAKKLIACLCDAKQEKVKHGELHIDRIGYYKRRYERIFREGYKQNPENTKKHGNRGRPKQTKAFNLLRRLKEYKMDVLRFMYDSEIPFDNNQAERDIRMIKVQQKISGTFRSSKGAESFCVIMSYISSLKKCGQSVFHAFENLFSGNIILPNALETAE